jgi:fluoride exporter
MPLWMWVATGGALGSVGRYALGTSLTRVLGPGFPWGTLVVNVAGSLAMGILAFGLAHRWPGAEHLRIFLMTGILGGFTTFSAFSLDAMVLAQRGEVAWAAAYVLGSVVLSLVAVMAGFALARGVWA